MVNSFLTSALKFSVTESSTAGFASVPCADGSNFGKTSGATDDPSKLVVVGGSVALSVITAAATGEARAAPTAAHNTANEQVCLDMGPLLFPSPRNAPRPGVLVTPTPFRLAHDSGPRR